MIGSGYEVYRDENCALGREGGRIFVEINGEKFALTCHPYEPCLYITDKNGVLTAVHNAFDPSYVLEAFSDARTVRSITGHVYDARDFCRMVGYAAGRVNIQIDEAELVFAGEKSSGKASGGKASGGKASGGKASGVASSLPETGKIIDDDPFYALIARYPDLVIDYCLVRNEHVADGYNAHRQALLRASRKLFIDENGEVLWQFDVSRADAEELSADELFAPAGNGGALNYRRAFLEPPHTNSYTDSDFDAVNAALFPLGTDALEVFAWSTGWSEYFDDGREWWGTLCLTVYDKRLHRFAVIMASATD